MNIAPNSAPPKTKLVGMLQPLSDRAIAATAALDEGRIADAEQHVAAMTRDRSIDRAWRLLLTGRIAIRRSDFAAAQAALSEAALLATAEGSAEEIDSDLTVHRLAACALNELGRVYRRRDLHAPALSVHRAAYQLRLRYGSVDEIGESASELGLDHDVTGAHADAERWHRTAVEAAEQSATTNPGALASAWTRLYGSLEKGERYADAVEAARSARERWRQHDAGSSQAANADLGLGGSLLKYAASLRERSDDNATTHLKEAIKWLVMAHESLLAFGPDCAADVRWCSEQLDFAKGLLESVTDSP